jgi:hypothetical protein
MAKQRETSFKEKAMARLKTLPNSWWVKVQMLAVCGIPDILGCVNGHFFALELKADAETLRANRDGGKLQDYVLGKIRNAGGFAAKVCPEDFEDAFAYIERVAKGEVSVRVRTANEPTFKSETH